VRLWIK